MAASPTRRDEEFGLARLVAGYAWKWESKKDPPRADIHLDGISLQWNRTDKDWIRSDTSLAEVGSIHTVQGHDLNYVGVIIGPDLQYTDELGFHTRRDWIHDRKGKEDSRVRNRTYSDAELLAYIQNIYGVLLTRGIRGTFVYATDPGVRRILRLALS